jgi:putative ABC transport system permease protein
MGNFIESFIFILKDATELGLIWGIMALGIFISFRVLDFSDLTSEGTVTLGGAMATSLILSEVSPIIATIAAIIVGFLAGMITGFLHTKLRIPGILAGIITMTGLYSINLRIMGKASLHLGDLDTIYSPLINLINDPNDSFLPIALTVLLIVALVFLFIYYFFGTELGMSIRITGMNQTAARSQGINTNLMIILGLGISNALISLSGALSVQNSGSSNMDIGKGAIVIGLVSIIIGEVIFGKRTFKNWLISVILGSIIYQALVGIAIVLGLNPNDLKLLQAILIAIILGLPVIKPFLKKYKSKGATNAIN